MNYEQLASELFPVPAPKDERFEVFSTIRTALRRQEDFLSGIKCGQEGRWEPIETAPRDGTVIDLWLVRTVDGECGREIDVIYKHGRWVTLEGNYPAENEYWTATHWMPLPPSPIK